MSSNRQFSDEVKSFLSKCDEYEPGERCIALLSKYFEDLAQSAKKIFKNVVSEDDVLKFMGCILRYLQCIIEYAGVGNILPVKPLKTRQLCGIITDTVEDLNLKNECLKNLSLEIFEVILDPELQSWNVKEILRMYIRIMENSDKAVRSSVIDDKGVFYMGRLMDLIPFGDYELQALIVETLYRMCSKEVLYKMEKALCLKTEEQEKAFLNINTKQFDLDVRSFLNLLNDKERNVISLLCHKVYFDEIQLKEPPELVSFRGMWIDFNIKVRTITFFINNMQFSGNTMHETEAWEMVTIFSDTISNAEMIYKFNEERGRQDAIGKFTLKRPCQMCYTDSHKLSNCKTLTLFSSDVGRFKNIINQVLPNMRHKIKTKSFDAALPAKRVYKPLDIISIKSNITNPSTTLNLTFNTEIIGKNRKHISKSVDGKAVSIADSTIHTVNSSKSKSVSSKKSMDVYIDKLFEENSLDISLDSRILNIKQSIKDNDNEKNNFDANSSSTGFSVFASARQNELSSEQNRQERKMLKVSSYGQKFFSKLQQIDNQEEKTPKASQHGQTISKVQKNHKTSFYGESFNTEMMKIEADSTTLGSNFCVKESDEESVSVASKVLSSLETDVYKKIEKSKSQGVVSSMRGKIETITKSFEADKIKKPENETEQIPSRLLVGKYSYAEDTNSENVLKKTKNKSKINPDSRKPVSFIDQKSVGSSISGIDIDEKISKLENVLNEGIIAVSNIGTTDKIIKQNDQKSLKQKNEKNEIKSANKRKASVSVTKCSPELFSSQIQELEDIENIPPKIGSKKHCTKKNPGKDLSSRVGVLGLTLRDVQEPLVDPVRNDPHDAFDDLKLKGPVRSVRCQEYIKDDEIIKEPELVRIPQPDLGKIVSESTEAFETARTDLEEVEIPETQFSVGKSFELFQDISQEMTRNMKLQEDSQETEDISNLEWSRVKILANIKIKSPEEESRIRTQNQTILTSEKNKDQAKNLQKRKKRKSDDTAKRPKINKEIIEVSDDPDDITEKNSNKNHDSTSNYEKNFPETCETDIIILSSEHIDVNDELPKRSPISSIQTTKSSECAEELLKGDEDKNTDVNLKAYVSNEQQYSSDDDLPLIFLKSKITGEISPKCSDDDREILQQTPSIKTKNRESDTCIGDTAILKIDDNNENEIGSPLKILENVSAASENKPKEKLHLNQGDELKESSEPSVEISAEDNQNIQKGEMKIKNSQELRKNTRQGETEPNNGEELVSGSRQTSETFKTLEYRQVNADGGEMSVSQRKRNRNSKSNEASEAFGKLSKIRCEDTEVEDLRVPLKQGQVLQDEKSHSTLSGKTKTPEELPSSSAVITTQDIQNKRKEKLKKNQHESENKSRKIEESAVEEETESCCYEELVSGSSQKPKTLKPSKSRKTKIDRDSIEVGAPQMKTKQNSKNNKDIGDTSRLLKSPLSYIKQGNELKIKKTDRNEELHLDEDVQITFTPEEYTQVSAISPGTFKKDKKSVNMKKVSTGAKIAAAVKDDEESEGNIFSRLRSRSGSKLANSQDKILSQEDNSDILADSKNSDRIGISVANSERISADNEVSKIKKRKKDKVNHKISQEKQTDEIHSCSKTQSPSQDKNINCKYDADTSERKHHSSTPEIFSEEIVPDSMTSLSDKHEKVTTDKNFDGKGKNLDVSKMDEVDESVLLPHSKREEMTKFPNSQNQFMDNSSAQFQGKKLVVSSVSNSQSKIISENSQDKIVKLSQDQGARANTIISGRKRDKKSARTDSQDRITEESDLLSQEIDLNIAAAPKRKKQKRDKVLQGISQEKLKDLHSSKIDTLYRDGTYDAGSSVHKNDELEILCEEIDSEILPSLIEKTKCKIASNSLEQRVRRVPEVPELVDDEFSENDLLPLSKIEKRIKLTNSQDQFMSSTLTQSRKPNSTASLAPHSQAEIISKYFQDKTRGDIENLCQDDDPAADTIPRIRRKKKLGSQARETEETNLFSQKIDVEVPVPTKKRRKGVAELCSQDEIYEGEADAPEVLKLSQNIEKNASSRQLGNKGESQTDQVIILDLEESENKTRIGRTTYDSENISTGSNNILQVNETSKQTDVSEKAANKLEISVDDFEQNDEAKLGDDSIETHARNMKNKSPNNEKYDLFEEVERSMSLLFGTDKAEIPSDTFEELVNQPNETNKKIGTTKDNSLITTSNTTTMLRATGKKLYNPEIPEKRSDPVPPKKQVNQLRNYEKEGNVTFNTSSMANTAGILRRGRKLYNPDNPEETFMYLPEVPVFDKVEVMDQFAPSKTHSKSSGKKVERKTEMKNETKTERVLEKKNKTETECKNAKEGYTSRKMARKSKNSINTRTPGKIMKHTSDEKRTKYGGRNYRTPNSRRLGALIDGVLDQLKSRNQSDKTRISPPALMKSKTLRRNDTTKYDLDFSMVNIGIEMRKKERASRLNRSQREEHIPGLLDHKESAADESEDMFVQKNYTGGDVPNGKSEQRVEHRNERGDEDECYRKLLRNIGNLFLKIAGAPNRSIKKMTLAAASFLENF